MRRSVLIYNLKAGHWRTVKAVENLTAILVGRGFEVEALSTEETGHATRLAQRAASQGADTVFVFGGDGTIREAAAGLLGSTTALGPIPGGTSNVICYSLGLPPDPLAAVAELSRLSPQDMDVGLCGDQVFLMQASVGLDARIMARLHYQVKRYLGRPGILGTGLVQWSLYEFPVIELLVDGQHFQATFAAVCNLSHYGGKWAMAPDASPHDRLLDLVFFQGIGRAPTLGFSLDFLRGRHLSRADVERLVIEEVELRGPANANLQVDGDAVPLRLPVTIRLAPQRLRILAP